MDECPLVVRGGKPVIAFDSARKVGRGLPVFAHPGIDDAPHVQGRIAFGVGLQNLAEITERLASHPQLRQGDPPTVKCRIVPGVQLQRLVISLLCFPPLTRPFGNEALEHRVRFGDPPRKETVLPDETFPRLSRCCRCLCVEDGHTPQGIFPSFHVLCKLLEPGLILAQDQEGLLKVVVVAHVKLGLDPVCPAVPLFVYHPDLCEGWDDSGRLLGGEVQLSYPDEFFEVVPQLSPEAVLNAFQRECPRCRPAVQLSRRVFVSGRKCPLLGIHKRKRG